MDKMAFLSAVEKFRFEATEIEGLGGVNIKKFTAGDVATFDVRLEQFKEKYPSSGIVPWLLIGLCDDAGKPLFVESDIAELMELPADFVAKVVEKIFAVNKVATKPAEAVEEAEKN